MNVFTFIGWLVVLVFDIIITIQGFGLYRLHRGFTGRINWLSVAMMLAGVVGVFGLLRVAPFHIEMN